MLVDEQPQLFELVKQLTVVLLVAFYLVDAVHDRRMVTSSELLSDGLEGFLGHVSGEVDGDVTRVRDSLRAFRGDHVVVRYVEEALDLALDVCDVDLLVLDSGEEVLQEFLRLLDADAVLPEEGHVAHESRD